VASPPTSTPPISRELPGIFTLEVPYSPGHHLPSASAQTHPSLTFLRFFLRCYFSFSPVVWYYHHPPLFFLAALLSWRSAGALSFFSVCFISVRLFPAVCRIVSLVLSPFFFPPRSDFGSALAFFLLSGFMRDESGFWSGSMAPVILT